MHRRHLVAAAVIAGALALPASAIAAPPHVSTGGAKNVTFNSATLTGSVNPEGSETDYYFQYGPTTHYTAQTPLTPLGNGKKTIEVSAPISGLTPVTKYHFRLVAVGAGTVVGGDHSFTTKAIPLSVQVNTSPNPVLYGNPFVIDGVLSGTGNGNRPVQLQATPFPYTAPFANVGNAVLTHPDGTFSITFAGLLQTAKLRVVTANPPQVTSPEVIESVAVKVGLHVKRVKRRGFIRLSGTITPTQVGAQVVLQRLTRKGPRTVGTTSSKRGTSTTSVFSAVVRKYKHTLYRATVTFPGGLYVPNSSLPVLVR